MNPYLLINIKQKLILTAPTNWGTVDFLMGKLSHKLNVICALEAAKMVILIWEDFAYDPKAHLLNKEQKEAPRKAIETVERWLERKVTVDEVLEMSDIVFNVVSFVDKMTAPLANAAANAINAIANTAKTVDILAAPVIVADAVVDAVDALVEDTIENERDADFTRLDFYSNWWDTCYPFIDKELQDQYDLLCKKINGE